MKKYFAFLASISMSLPALAAVNDMIRISHGMCEDYAALSAVDSLYFDPSGTLLYIQPVGGGSCVSIPYAEISGISYLPADSCPSRLRITYSEGAVAVENPYFLTGVSVLADGAHVIVTNSNETDEYTTELTGASSDGSFQYNGTYKTTLVLNGVNLTSSRGAAIDIECGKRVALEIKKNSENTLVDAAGGEQKAALYCKGHLEFDKAGILNVTGRTGHAISAKEYIKMKKSEGTINILGAVKDGIHCKQYYQGNGFTININNVGDDGIQSELDGEANDDGIVDGSLIINGGNYAIVNSTNGSKEGTDTHTAKGLNADGDMLLAGGTINISMTGIGGKGIRVEGTYVQGAEDGSGPDLTVSTTGSAYSTSTGGTGGGGGWGGGRPGGGGGGGNSSSAADAKAIKVLGAITIYGGTTHVTTAQNGAEGLESKTSITIKGGNHYFKCYDDCINSSGILEFAGGNTVCYSFGNDAIDSNYGRTGAITISGGNVFAYTSKASPEEGLDCDNNSYIVITGGIAISAGGSQGGGWGGSSNSVGSSTQGYYLGNSPSSYSTSYYYTLCNTSGEAICTYRFEANISNSLSLLTASNLGKGSISVKRGDAAPTEAAATVTNSSGAGVFFVNPTVETTATAATVTSK